MAESSLRDSCVYFAQSAKTGLVKIGSTTRIYSRLYSLGPKADGIRLLGTMPGGLRHERDLQRLFSHFRERGEWFLPSPLLLEFIAANVDPGSAKFTKPDKMFFRIDPLLRREFRAEVHRRGWLIEDRVADLIRRDLDGLRRKPKVEPEPEVAAV